MSSLVSRRSAAARPYAWTRLGVGLAAVILAVVERDDLGVLDHPGVVRVPVAAWLPAPAAGLAAVLCGIWAVAGISLVAGRWPQISAGVIACCGSVTLLLDQQLYSNHLLLMVLLAVLLAAARDEGTAPPWPALLISTQISTVYLWTGIAKINGSWLSGEVLAAYLRQPLSHAPTLALQAMAIATVVVEITLAVALWHPRSVRAAVLVGTLLHVGIALTVVETEQLIPFGLLMISTYPLFLARMGYAVPLLPWVSRKFSRLT